MGENINGYKKDSVHRDTKEGVFLNPSASGVHVWSYKFEHYLSKGAFRTDR